ncbi:hypothetical protein [Massilia yuzhufengensis]|uniref:Restriction alleviation protein Lar n=1 Tax=Massilia yuzhufengensis TaxID=1164594 RepID=A0A1I1JZ41_9BURK|nr:hypothetical protein [Massilia yuzhufengensis]SFC51778.1 hypothetical protein SAMN05216204_10728 [Massilia yuzhufengensis]
MSEKNVSPKPQNCPKCHAPAEVRNPRLRRWFAVCSKSSELAIGHRVIGHPMFTKRDAIIEWNKLS